MQKREDWRKGIRLTARQIRDLEGARLEAQEAKDFEFDRRLRALLLVGRDMYTQPVAATMLEMSASAITYWVMYFRSGGVDSLRTGKAPGAQPKLDPAQLPALKQMVVDGPEACGFDTGVWDSKLVKKLILSEFGVKYSTSQIRRILRKLGFSVQYPKRVFARADEKAQKTWLLTEYPKIKKKRRPKAGS